MRDQQFPVGARVMFKSQWPFHTHFGRVEAIEPCPNKLGEGHDNGARIRWEGDQYFPEMRGTVTFVGFWNQRLQPAEEKRRLQPAEEKR